MVHLDQHGSNTNYFTSGNTYRLSLGTISGPHKSIREQNTFIDNYCEILDRHICGIWKYDAIGDNINISCIMTHTILILILFKWLKIKNILEWALWPKQLLFICEPRDNLHIGAVRQRGEVLK